ncbi:MAG: hypothetical protein J6Z80_02185, partial [Clostridia bacterium]|nr:hypothetical protein [Clostridia bacterium]
NLCQFAQGALMSGYVYRKPPEKWVIAARKADFAGIGARLGLDQVTVRLLVNRGLSTEEEMRARYEIMLESYVKLTYIEALTMTDMARREILPAVASYRRTLTGETMFENDLSRRLKVLTDNAYFKMRELEKAVADAKSETETRDASFICLKRILPTMKLLRGYCDAAESLTSEEFWPFPSYGDLLFALN